MPTANLFSSNIYQRMSFGDYGFRILDYNHGEASVPSNEKFGAISVLENTTVTLTSNASGGDSGLSNIDISEGHTLVGDFSTISISKGKVICYIRK